MFITYLEKIGYLTVVILVASYLLFSFYYSVEFLNAPRVTNFEACYPLDLIMKKAIYNPSSFFMTSVFLTASIVTDTWNIFYYSINSIPKFSMYQQHPPISYPLTFCFINKIKPFQENFSKESSKIGSLFIKTRDLLVQNGIILNENFHSSDPTSFIEEAMNSFNILSEQFAHEEESLVRKITQTLEVQDLLKRYVYDASIALSSLYGRNEVLMNAFNRASLKQNAFYATLNQRDFSSEPLSLTPRFHAALNTCDVNEKEFFDAIASNLVSEFLISEKNGDYNYNSFLLPELKSFLLDRKGPFFERFCYKVAFDLQKKMSFESGPSRRDIFYSIKLFVQEYFKNTFFTAFQKSKSFQELLNSLSSAIFDDSNYILSSPVSFIGPDSDALIHKSNTSSSPSPAYPKFYQLMIKPKPNSQKMLESLKATNPVTALTPGVDLGQAWVMEGSSGYLTLELAKPIIPAFFSLQTLPLEADPNPTAAPKELEIWGSSQDQSFALIAKHKMEITSDKITFIDPLNRNQGSLPIKTLQLRILSNRGYRLYTKLYHFAAYAVST